MTTENSTDDKEPTVGGNGSGDQPTGNGSAGAEGGRESGPQVPAPAEPAPGGADDGQPAGISEEKPEPPAPDFRDQYLRLQAEFENFKKRMHKEQSEMLKYAQLPLLRDLTGVMDNLERAIGHAKESDNPDQGAFVSGLEMVTKQINDIFERYGMLRIQAAGEEFDPTRHEAMNVVETDEVPDNNVLHEIQTGYSLHERIVRPAMVTVAKKPPVAPDENAEPNKADQS